MRAINATIAILGLTIITPARGATLHVPTDYGTIQACIDAAVDGVDECVVAPGTYYETINFNGKAITVRSSDGQAVTTIDAMGAATCIADDCSVVKCTSGEGVDTVLDGFTITGGTGTLVDSRTRGGGMYNDGSSPTLTNCIFSGNSAGDGGGMYNDQGSSPTVTNCTFGGNSATSSGGGMRNKSGSPTLTNCTFSGNSASDEGGGMYNLVGSSPTLTNCIFSGNSAGVGGGMYNDQGSSPTVTNCTFGGNSATYLGGGMCNERGSPTLTNCTFSGNSAGDEGGGMYSSSGGTSNPTLTNCTFSGNSANNGSGGGMYNLNGSSTLMNCILWNNSPEQVEGSANISYSCVQDGWPGAGNIAVDPLFVDGDGVDDIPGSDDDDLRLQFGSPCIDMGRNGVVTVSTDLDGNPRIIDGDQDGTATVDMGAYEFTLPLICGNGVLDPGEECDDGGESETCDVDCTLAECGDDTLNVTAGEQCDDGNPFSGDGCDVACMSETVELYVPSDLPTIQTCIDVAVIGNECVVAPGTYYETINFNGKAITVRSSGGAEVTTIDATDLNDSVVKCISGEGADTVLDGFTITGGTGTLVGGSPRGGGMYNDGSSPTLTSCIFSGNSARDGGGMYNDQGSSPTVTNCTFSGNSVTSLGGGMYNESGGPTLTNCTFSDNSAGAGGGMLTGGNPTLTNCTFSGNSADKGGGMRSSGDPTLTNCTFSGNSANSGGGGMYSFDNPTLTNCTFSENTAGRGGGMYNWSGGPTLTDCTFSENSAVYYGGGMYGSNSTLTNCTFRGNSADSGGGGMYGSYGGNATLTNCTFGGNSASEGGGMYNESTPTLTNCTFSGNSANSLGGGVFSYGSPTLTNCTFSGNSAGHGGGMYNGGSNTTLTNCTFSENSASNSGGGMNIWSGGNATLTNCILWNNSPEQVEGSATVNYSCLQDGWPGTGNIAVDPLFVDADGVDGIPGSGDDDLRLQFGSPCIDMGRNGVVTVPTDLDGNPRVMDGDQDGTATVDMGAYEFALPLICGDGILDPGEECDDSGESETCDVDCTLAYCGDDTLNVAAGEQCDDGNLVSGDGCSAECMIEHVELHVPGDFATIQTCINAAVIGNECVVAPGTYYEKINFNGTAITVRSSGGAEVTTIDATGLSDSVVKCISGEGAGTVLDGFTITGGTGTVFGSYTRGGGMYNDQGSSPTVTDCTFSENSAYSGGGLSNGGSPSLTNCTFSGNSAFYTGGGLSNYGSPKLTNCIFSGNSAGDGGGGMSNSGSPTLTKCTFSGNSAGLGGGMSNWSGSSPTLTKCAFSGNSAGNGGGMYNSGSPTLTDCTFSGNSASDGGGMYFSDSSTTLTNCTFSGNSGTNGNALACYYPFLPQPPSTVKLINCILWDGVDEIWNNDGSTITITYSNIQGGWTGPGSNNLDTDPLFVDPGFWDDNGTPGDPSDDVWIDGDYRLQTASPCIDAGDPAFVPQPGETDLDGHARVLCSYVDMGAYEFGIGDQDCDDIVDLTDFAQWDACLTGPDAGPYEDGCEAFDFDGDTDIDLADFAGFQTVFQGP